MKEKTTRATAVAAALLAGMAAAAPARAADDPEPVRSRDLIGRPAPPLAVEESLAGAEPAAWPEALAGRAMVVDFWSTWCVPCVEGLPRWNAMVDELAGEPVTFLAITDEPAEAVEPFLETRRVAGWIGLDRDRSAFDAYGALAIPQAVLIDAHGVVRGVGHTDRVTPAMVRRLIAGEDVGLVPDPSTEELLAASRSDAAEAIFEVGLWPSKGGSSTIRYGGDSFVALNVPLALMAPMVWEMPSARVQVADDLPAGRFDLVVRTAGDAEAVRPLARRALETGLGIEVRRETREVEALVVRVAGDELGTLPAGLRRARASSSSRSELRPGSLIADRVSVRQIAEMVERELRRPVVDETGLEGEYGIEMVWEPGDAESLTAAVEALGLEVIPARREVEMVVVARRAGAEPWAHVQPRHLLVLAALVALVAGGVVGLRRLVRRRGLGAAGH